MILRIVYYKDDNFEVMDIEAFDWVTKAPHGILKLFVKRGDGWIEWSGLNGYIVKNVEGRFYVGGIQNSNLTDEKGNTVKFPLESVTKEHPEMKYGIEIPDEEWLKLCTMDLTK